MRFSHSLSVLVAVVVHRFWCSLRQGGREPGVRSQPPSRFAAWVFAALRRHKTACHGEGGEETDSNAPAPPTNRSRKFKIDASLSSAFETNNFRGIGTEVASHEKRQSWICADLLRGSVSPW